MSSPPKPILLLIFIHGFKGTDATFANFPTDLRNLLTHSLPDFHVRTEVYPRYETRGDLARAVGGLREWLENKVVDLEVARGTKMPMVRPGVQVVLMGHSMGGIVAAEVLLSVAAEEGLVGRDTPNNTTTTYEMDPGKRAANLSTSSPPSSNDETNNDRPTISFPYIRAVLAFDTPFLGISPGVLAHSAEAQINQASTAYKAFSTATDIFGWGSPRSGTPVAAPPIPNAPALPPPDTSPWTKWSKYAAYGAAAAGIAGAAGAVYASRGQIAKGWEWAGSHLEFVGCLAKGAELQGRVERVVEVGRRRGVGFVNFYGELGRKGEGYAGGLVGGERTFCVVPRESRKRGHPDGGEEAKRKKREGASGVALEEEGMRDGEKVQAFVEDVGREKGRWVRVVNEGAADEVKAHTGMFEPGANSGYYGLLGAARDGVVEWVDQTVYREQGEGGGVVGEGKDAVGGAEVEEEVEVRYQQD